MSIETSEEIETLGLVKVTAAERRSMEAVSIVRRWDKMIEKVVTMFTQMRSPFNSWAISRGVRLEDVKRDPQRIMPQIAAWIGIPDHPALYEASFCGLQYWGPPRK